MTHAVRATLVALIGSAIGIWIWRRNSSKPERARGVVIYRNTPTVSESA
jgi:hypothetical protein